MYLHESYNIEALNFLLDSININIPQLKAFNLMKFTRKITTEELNEMIIENEVANVAALIDDYHRWNDPRLQPTLNYEMKPSKRRRYLKYDEETGWDESVRWENIHGRHRKTAKFECKKDRKNIIKNVNTFNKYVGQDNILRVCARLGGFNWIYFRGDRFTKHPAFLEKIDCVGDSTFCDIYLKISPQLI